MHKQFQIGGPYKEEQIKERRHKRIKEYSC